jgi:hypothetical protein
MAEYTKSLFLQALEDWGHLPEAFEALSAAEQAQFLKDQGFASLHDLLAHVGAWWEEGQRVIAERLKDHKSAGRKYDFAAFNAAAVKRFKSMPEADFMAWFGTQRQKVVALVSALTDEQMKVRGVAAWLNGVILEHLKEHGVDAPRFLTIDMLQREWDGYRGRFERLTAEKQAAYLKKQGFARFRDVLAHIIAWWEHGIGVVEAAAGGKPSEAEDVDAFNAAAVERFGKLEEAEVLRKYDETRLTLMHLVDSLPEEVLEQPDVQTWLRADVLEHYYEHAI